MFYHIFGYHSIILSMLAKTIHINASNSNAAVNSFPQLKELDQRNNSGFENQKNDSNLDTSSRPLSNPNDEMFSI